MMHLLFDLVSRNDINLIYFDKYNLVFSYKNNIIDQFIVKQKNIYYEYYDIVIPLKNRFYSYKTQVYGFNNLRNYLSMHLDYYFP